MKAIEWLLNSLPLPSAAGIFMISGTAVLTGIGAGCVRLGRWLGRRCTADMARLHIAVIFLLTAYVVYAALRGDWMGEYRFLTPAFLFGPAAVLGLVYDVARWRRAPRLLPAAVALGAVVVAGVIASQRTHAFAARPTISLEQVREKSRMIAARLTPLGRQAIVLTPDIGGALWEDRFRVLDAVGLIDRRIGRPALRRDREALRRHVLLVRRPDAMWLHSIWYGHLGFAGDAEFSSLYRPLEEHRLAPEGAPEWGFYVREDLAATLSANPTIRGPDSGNHLNQ